MKTEKNQIEPLRLATEAAKFLGISVRTFHRKIKPLLTPVRATGMFPRYRESDLNVLKGETK